MRTLDPEIFALPRGSDRSGLGDGQGHNAASVPTSAGGALRVGGHSLGGARPIVAHAGAAVIASLGRSSATRGGPAFAAELERPGAQTRHRGVDSRGCRVAIHAGRRCSRSPPCRRSGTGPYCDEFSSTPTLTRRADAWHHLDAILASDVPPHPPDAAAHTTWTHRCLERGVARWGNGSYTVQSRSATRPHECGPETRSPRGGRLPLFLPPLASCYLTT